MKADPFKEAESEPEPSKEASGLNQVEPDVTLASRTKLCHESGLSVQGWS